MAPIIRELSKSMINKIAAGEVIERPANVVKELGENALDAGATSIEIYCDRQDGDLIKIVDNGCGIASDQLVAALSPHSTSKISEADDLFKISTLGFRGEALASIAEVSQLVLTSRVAEASEGARIQCDGGAFSPIKPVGRAVGTTVEARNLFFNVPARRKFLKTPQTEFQHVYEAVVRLATPHIGVSFVLKRDGRTVLELPAETDMLERIRRIYGDAVADKLTRVESTRKNVKISGYVGLPDLSRGTATLQYLFINGRYFRDKSLSHALLDAYQGLLLPKRFPVAFVNIETPPDFVDVNVHPAKLEARFVDGQAMYAGLLHGLRERFFEIDLRSRPDGDEIAAAANLTHEEKATQRKNDERDPEKAPRPLEFKTDQDKTKPEHDREPDDDPDRALDSNVAAKKREAILGWVRNEAKERRAARENEEQADRSEIDPALERENAEKTFDAANDALQEAARDRRRERANPQIDPREIATRLAGGVPEFKKFPPLNGGFAPHNRADDPNATPRSPRELRAAVAAANEELRDARATKEKIARTSEGKPVVQMCGAYLVMEVEDGVAIVDQHALHERVLFEKVKASLVKGEVVVQRLLNPAVVDLNPTEAAFVGENVALFEKVGLIVAPFGGTSIVVEGYPALFRDVAPEDVFHTALAVFRDKKSKVDLADLVDDALKQTACKAAIKAGDSLSVDAIIELVALAEEEINAHHCPHGRPSTLVFSRAELDKLFKRT